MPIKKLKNHRDKDTETKIPIRNGDRGIMSHF